MANMRGSDLESYAHKAAKAVVSGWLREAASAAFPGDNWVTSLGITWRINRPGPHFGIWEEYPLVEHQTIVWDEVDARWQNAPPTLEDLRAEGVRPRAILDIAIQHKGVIADGIEIVHTSDLSATKTEYLRRMGITVFVVDASWVLRQVRRPELLKCIRVINAPPFSPKEWPAG